MGQPNYYELSSVREREAIARKYESLAIHLFREQNLGVICMPQRIRAETESRKSFELSKDLFLFLDTKKKLWIEVKSKDEYFTDDPDGWPFEDVTLYATNKGAERPFAVVFLSQRTQKALAVMNDETWFEGEQEDRKRSTTYPVLKAPVSSLISFSTLIERVFAELRPVETAAETEIVR